ncbi:CDPK-related kinase 7 [Bienertia sinuspersici]
MGLCHAKPIEIPETQFETEVINGEIQPISSNSGSGKTPKFPFYSPSPLPSGFKNSPANSSVTSTPLRFFKRPFPPPSPAKHIRALLARRHGSVKPNEASIPEGSESGIGLDKNFGFSKQFANHYELGEEVGRGHFGYTCYGKGKKGSLKGLDVAVKVIPKAKMTTAIAIEDVRREVKILRALTGHKNLVQFYESYEDDDNVYVVMELCQGGELLDRILSRGGKFSEDDAKVVMIQILSVVAYCHLQGVVHRDLKPENFLFTSKDENSPLKAIDFGLSDYVKPDERLNDIVGSAYYVAPEVLHRAYGTEADMWSIGVIAYILLCGSRPFWARTESGIFRAVLKADPCLDEAPWPSLSPEAIDFVKRLSSMACRSSSRHKDPSGYDSVQACKSIHMLIFSAKSSSRGSCKDINSASVSLFKGAISDAISEQKRLHINAKFQGSYIEVSSIQYRKMDFEEFCAAATSVHQLEAMDTWEQHARRAYELFEKDGNRPIMIEELASELGLSPSVPVHVVLQDWIRHSDGKLSFLGFVRLLHGVSSRTFQKAN